MPRPLAVVISAGRATLHELDTVYGPEDLYMLLEIVLVDAHNRAVMGQAEE